MCMRQDAGQWRVDNNMGNYQWTSIYTIFGAEAPRESGAEDRTELGQALWQLLALVTAVGIGFVGGLIAGGIASFFQPPEPFFHDTFHMAHLPSEKQHHGDGWNS